MVAKPGNLLSEPYLISSNMYGYIRLILARVCPESSNLTDVLGLWDKGLLRAASALMSPLSLIFILILRSILFGPLYERIYVLNISLNIYKVNCVTSLCKNHVKNQNNYQNIYGLEA